MFRALLALTFYKVHGASLEWSKDKVAKLNADLRAQNAEKNALLEEGRKLGLHHIDDKFHSGATNDELKKILESHRSRRGAENYDEDEALRLAMEESMLDEALHLSQLDRSAEEAASESLVETNAHVTEDRDALRARENEPEVAGLAGLLSADADAAESVVETKAHIAVRVKAAMNKMEGNKSIVRVVFRDQSKTVAFPGDAECELLKDWVVAYSVLHPDSIGWEDLRAGNFKIVVPGQTFNPSAPLSSLHGTTVRINDT